MSAAGIMLIRLAVAVLVIAAAAGQVAHLDALSGATLGIAGALARNPRPSFFALVLADAFVSTIAGILALVLVFRGDSSRGARGLGVALAAWSYLLAYSGIVVIFRPDPGLLRLLFEAHFPVVEMLGLAGLIAFTTRFPRRLTAGDLRDGPDLPTALRAVQRMRVWLLTPAGPWAAAAALLLVLFGINGAMGRAVEDAALNPLMDLFRFTAVGLVFLNLRRSWLLASPTEKASLWWLVAGFGLLLGSLALIIGGNILMTVTGWGEPPFAWRPLLLDLGLVGFLAGASAGVLYRGARDAAAVSKRLFSAIILATAALFVAAGLEVLFSTALVGRISFPPGMGTAFTAALAIIWYGHAHRLVDRMLSHL